MKIKAFKRSYGGRIVLDMPETELCSGKAYAVIGANGSGKSTLARVVAGTERADDKNAVISDVTVGYMPQKSYAFRMSVLKNLLVNGNDTQRAQTLLDALEIAHLADKPAHKLSGGETARMALARLLMRDYELLILDEPTAAMDMESVFLTERLLTQYKERTGCTLLLVTHSLRQAERLADEALFLDGGKLIERGKIADMIKHPLNDKTKQFIELYGV